MLTANGTREMSDALRRRCLHAFVDYPDPEREIAIVERKVTGIDRALASSLARFIERVRKLDLTKPPSVGETVDWARALLTLGRSQLDRELVLETLCVIAKHDADRQTISASLGDLLAPEVARS